MLKKAKAFSPKSELVRELVEKAHRHDLMVFTKALNTEEEIGGDG